MLGVKNKPKRWIPLSLLSWIGYIGTGKRRFLMKQLIDKCKDTELGRSYRLAKLLNIDDGVGYSNN